MSVEYEWMIQAGKDGEVRFRDRLNQFSVSEVALLTKPNCTLCLNRYGYNKSDEWIDLYAYVKNGELPTHFVAGADATRVPIKATKVPTKATKVPIKFRREFDAWSRKWSAAWLRT
tara:strand:+ start:239 stop:586 length:348 start_codon:yes stop_codon:yes gene_type:complete